MSTEAQFVWGFAGSLATEVITLYQLYMSTNFDDPQARVLPARYRKVGFWIVRTVVAIMAGGLAVVYGINNPLLAINVGAATPLIIQALGQGLKNPVPLGAASSTAPTSGEPAGS
jgi:hypothetical protein